MKNKTFLRYAYIRDMFLHKEMHQLLMALDFDPIFQCWSETSPSKVITFIYTCTYSEIYLGMLDKKFFRIQKMHLRFYSIDSNLWTHKSNTIAATNFKRQFLKCNIFQDDIYGIIFFRFLAVNIHPRFNENIIKPWN